MAYIYTEALKPYFKRQSSPSNLFVRHVAKCPIAKLVLPDILRYIFHPQNKIVPARDSKVDTQGGHVVGDILGGREGNCLAGGSLPISSGFSQTKSEFVTSSTDILHDPDFLSRCSNRIRRPAPYFDPAV